MIEYDIKPSERIVFGVIGFLAFTENLVFALISLKNYWMLKMPYYAVVFSLVITDLLTGISLLITPAYILGNHLPFPEGKLSGAFFCYVLYSHFLPFALGSVSLFTIALLALERWYAVAAPFQYRESFKDPKKMIIKVITVWILGFTVTCILFTDVKYDFESKNKKCRSRDDETKTEKIVFAVLDFLRFLVPFTVSVISLVSLYRHLRRNRSNDIQSSTVHERDKALRMICKMALVTAVVMTICWLPNHISFFLYKVGFHVELSSWYHRSTVILCMSNACINPLIYLATNRVYRQEFLEAFICRDFGLRQTFQRLHEALTSSSLE